MNALILPFEDVDETMLSAVGGKGANLGVLTWARFPVPSGFCVTTSAYMLATNTLDLASILDELAATPASNLIHLHELAAHMRTQLLAAPMPESVVTAIQEAYQLLAGDKTPALPVAVRSSATAEDLPFASFAGQQDTYLNVVGAEALLDAVRRCWASLWTDRAVSYRANNNISPHAVHLAVVVQRMVEAQVAGILFTANPLTGKRRQAVIDANPGLGEAVVSGAVNPDHFVVNTQTGEVVERHIGEKHMLIRGTAGGGTEQVALEAQQEACLDASQLGELARLGQRVEEHYQAPQDIEWALDDQGKFWLIQARPITTLYPLPASVSNDTLRAYFSLNVAQGVFRPFTPMGASFLRRMVSEVAILVGMPPRVPGEPTFIAEAGMRLYMDLTTPFSNRLGRSILIPLMRIIETRSQPILEYLSHDARLPLTKKSRPASLLFLARILMRLHLPLRVQHGLRHPEQAMQMRTELLAELEQKAHLPECASVEQRLARVEELCTTFPANLQRVITFLGAGMLSTLLTYRLLKGIASGDEIQTTMRSLPINVTTEMDLELWAFAQRLRQDEASLDVMRGSSSAQIAQTYREGKLPPVLAEGLASFLHTYGHRGVAEIDMGLPRWSEQPEPILDILTNYLNHTRPEQAPDLQFERGAREAEEMIATLKQRAHQKSWLRGVAVSFMLRRMRALLGIREFPKFFVVKIFSYARAHLHIIGEELARTQCLEAANDIFFLYLPEVRSALDGKDFRGIVRARRETYAYELRRKHVPRILLSDGTDPETLLITQHAKGDETLRGIAASPGRITGRAHVILDPAGARLEQGEILVAPSTDPGWTPLFLTASALVMEMGGPMSHGSVVAREYGIPAVVGVPHATDHIVTGQLITVDGVSGTVSIEPEPEA